ncbi:hypothetical protein B0H13DRAFT_2353935 [Mycena leptocephala]|nr:hypothetical protein B0H13DRAFT_2353935 [Mycena leptocephala]
MVEFAKECYSEAECRARAVNVQGPPLTSGANSARASEGPGDHGGTAARTVPSAPADGGRGGRTEGASGDGSRGGGGGGSTSEGSGAPAPGPDDERRALCTLDEREDGPIANEGEDDEHGANGGQGSEEDAGGSGPDPDAVMQAHIDELWRREDRAEWTGELGRAHAAFARGRMWGVNWARCVSTFSNFESAHGYSEGQVQIDTTHRPWAVGDWLARSRQWDRSMPLGFLGAEETEGTWVASWWKWWVSLQPEERVYSDLKLAQPSRASWEKLVTMHGKNGLLQLMVTLLWWGDLVGDGEDACRYVEWTKAVDDVA